MRARQPGGARLRVERPRLLPGDPSNAPKSTSRSASTRSTRSARPAARSRAVWVARRAGLAYTAAISASASQRATRPIRDRPAAESGGFDALQIVPGSIAASPCRTRMTRVAPLGLPAFTAP